MSVVMIVTVSHFNNYPTDLSHALLCYFYFSL